MSALFDLVKPEVCVASAANEEKTECIIIDEFVDELSISAIAAIEAGVTFADWPDVPL